MTPAVPSWSSRERQRAASGSARRLRPPARAGQIPGALRVRTVASGLVVAKRSARSPVGRVRSRIADRDASDLAAELKIDPRGCSNGRRGRDKLSGCRRVRSERNRACRTPMFVAVCLPRTHPKWVKWGQLCQRCTAAVSAPRPRPWTSSARPHLTVCVRPHRSESRSPACPRGDRARGRVRDASLAVDDEAVDVSEVLTVRRGHGARAADLHFALRHPVVTERDTGQGRSPASRRPSRRRSGSTATQTSLRFQHPNRDLRR